MCNLEDIVVWILINFNNCKRHCTSPIRFYTNTFATDVSIIVSVNFWASLLNSTVITTNTCSQNLGLFQGTESMLSLIHFNVFIMSGPFFLQARLQHLGDLYPLWAERCLYCNLTPWCCYSSQFEDECWGLPVSVHRHPKVGKLCLNTYMQPFLDNRNCLLYTSPSPRD